MAISNRGIVVAVCADTAHRFSNANLRSVRLIEGHGVEGDAHAGAFIKHRYLARQNADVPNNREVHLVQSELFDQPEAIIRLKRADDAIQRAPNVRCWLANCSPTA